MTDIFKGGAKSFSTLYAENMKKRNKTQRRLKKKQNKKTYKKKCKCKINKLSMSPEGLGFCSKCNNIEVIIKGKNNKLWENKLINNRKKWVQIN